MALLRFGLMRKYRKVGEMIWKPFAIYQSIYSEEDKCLGRTLFSARIKRRTDKFFKRNSKLSTLTYFSLKNSKKKMHLRFWWISLRLSQANLNFSQKTIKSFKKYPSSSNRYLLKSEDWDFRSNPIIISCENF